MFTDWRRRRSTDEEQVANAPDDFVDLRPVSDAPAQQVRDAWASTLPPYSIPDEEA